MACGVCGKPDQGYGAVSYLDNYGVNASSYGIAPNCSCGYYRS